MLATEVIHLDLLQLLIGGIANGCIYGLIALGFVLIYKATEVVNFAQGDLMMLGAYMTLMCVNEQWLGLPFIPGVILAVAMTGFCAYCIERFIIRGVFGQPQFSVIILTIALGFVIRFIVGVVWGHEPQTIETPYAGQSLTLVGGGNELSTGNQNPGLVLGVDEGLGIILTVVIAGSLYLFFSRHRVGLAMQAAAQNQLAAYYMGIPVRQLNSWVWALAGGIAAIAGLIFASKGSVDPGSGLLGIKAFAAAVIGGFGSLPGALLGGLLIGVIEPFAARYFAAGYSQIAPYALMLLVLMIVPNGLFAQIQTKKL